MRTTRCASKQHVRKEFERKLRKLMKGKGEGQGAGTESVAVDGDGSNRAEHLGRGGLRDDKEGKTQEGRKGSQEEQIEMQ
jgi:hypothetical protein